MGLVAVLAAVASLSAYAFHVAGWEGTFIVCAAYTIGILAGRK